MVPSHQSPIPCHVRLWPFCHRILHCTLFVGQWTGNYSKKYHNNLGMGFDYDTLLQHLQRTRF